MAGEHPQSAARDLTRTTPTDSIASPLHCVVSHPKVFLKTVEHPLAQFDLASPSIACTPVKANSAWIFRKCVEPDAIVSHFHRTLLGKAK